jgi:hypothetical protein
MAKEDLLFLETLALPQFRSRLGELIKALDDDEVEKVAKLLKLQHVAVSNLKGRTIEVDFRRIVYLIGKYHRKTLLKRLKMFRIKSQEIADGKGEDTSKIVQESLDEPEADGETEETSD